MSVSNFWMVLTFDMKGLNIYLKIPLFGATRAPIQGLVAVNCSPVV
jgi:hypothetical protein